MSGVLLRKEGRDILVGGDLQRRRSGKGKKGGSFQLKRVAGCLAEGGLTKEFIQLQGAR